MANAILFKNKTLLMIITWLSFVVHSSILYAQATQYENQLIEKIEVVVENLPETANFDTNAVLKRIKTKAGEFFSQHEFDNDLKALALEFERVIPEIEIADGKLYITLKIWPKPTIRSINWTGNTKLKSKRLQKELAIASCTV